MTNTGYRGENDANQLSRSFLGRRVTTGTQQNLQSKWQSRGNLKALAAFIKVWLPKRKSLNGMPFLSENRRYRAGLTGTGIASTSLSRSKVQIRPQHMFGLIGAGVPAPEQEGWVKWSCYPEPFPLAGQWLACARRGWRTDPASICASCMCTRAPAMPPPPRPSGSGCRSRAGSQLWLSPSRSPPALPGAPACLFLWRWLVPGGVTCVPCSLESSHYPLPPSPLPSLLEQACAGLCLMPREICCSFLRAAQPLLSWPGFCTSVVTGRLV